MEEKGDGGTSPMIRLVPSAAGQSRGAPDSNLSFTCVSLNTCMHALTTRLKYIPVESTLAHAYQSNVDLLGTTEMLMSRKRVIFCIKLKIK